MTQKKPTATKEAPPKKSECPITKEQFFAHAGMLDMVLNGIGAKVPPKEFSTGSFGYYYNGKMDLMIDGKPVKLQVGLNVTVVGSRPGS